MLKKVKCSYFIKVLFSHVSEGQKLKMAKYNKALQATLDRRLIHYKSYSGRFIIYGSDGKGKEFNGFFNELIYEGEYKNGERNGKGKEYWGEDRLEFEGEYKNGKRNGKGKEYRGSINHDEKRIFEGEYLNNKPISGVSYTLKGNKKCNEYKVNYSNELKNGFFEEYNVDEELIFQGEYVNGVKNGKFIEYDEHIGFKFEGIYLNGRKWDGIGYDSLNNIIYELKGGKGFFKEYGKDEYLIYECEYKNGLKNGKGKAYYYRDDDKKEIVLVYEGEYLNGLKNGKGKEYKDRKLLFEGEFYNDNRLKGKYYMNGKLEFEGEFLYNKKWDGKGYDEFGNIIYELHNGTGKVRDFIDGDEDGIIFEGEYLNGLNNGKGKEYDWKGILLFEGEYKNGKRNGKGKEYGDFLRDRYFGESNEGNIKIKTIIIYNDYSKASFEGEYKNGKRIKGKEYGCFYGIISKQEYVEGKGWISTTEEFNENGKLLYEGEYLNGQRLIKD